MLLHLVPSPISYLLPAAFHIRHFSKDNLMCANDSNKSVERLRNIWISGLMDPTEMTLKARLLLHEGRVKECDEDRDYRFSMDIYHLLGFNGYLSS
jgi:hypothetical protein